MLRADLIAELSSCGSAMRELSRRERWQWMQTWREVYAASLHAKTWAWKKGAFDWHVFSFNAARALHGARAEDAYSHERPGTLLVIPENEQLPAVRLEAERLPNLVPIGQDIYVWPPDLTWTMAFTHEMSIGLGPFFSRREWMDD